MQRMSPLYFVMVFYRTISMLTQQGLLFFFGNMGQFSSGIWPSPLIPDIEIPQELVRRADNLEGMESVCRQLVWCEMERLVRWALYAWKVTTFPRKEDYTELWKEGRNKSTSEASYGTSVSWHRNGLVLSLIKRKLGDFVSWLLFKFL